MCRKPLRAPVSTRAREAAPRWGMGGLHGGPRCNFFWQPSATPSAWGERQPVALWPPTYPSAPALCRYLPHVARALPRGRRHQSLLCSSLCSHFLSSHRDLYLPLPTPLVPLMAAAQEHLAFPVSVLPQRWRRLSHPVLSIFASDRHPAVSDGARHWPALPAGLHWGLGARRKGTSAAFSVQHSQCGG